MRHLIPALLACALAACVDLPPVPDAPPGAPEKPTVTYTHDDDKDWSADKKPPAEQTPDDPDARAASFAETNKAALADAAAGRHARLRPYATPAAALQCESLLAEAEAAVGAAAAEMLNNSCARGDMVRPSECPAVAALVGADQALADAKCPARPRYPVLRDQ